MKEQVRMIPVDKLRGSRNHPFQVKDDAAMDALCESIAQCGVLSPLLARPRVEGYERSSPSTGGAQRPLDWAWTAPGAGAGGDRRRGRDPDGGRHHPEGKSAAQADSTDGPTGGRHGAA